MLDDEIIALQDKLVAEADDLREIVTDDTSHEDRLQKLYNAIGALDDLL